MKLRIRLTLVLAGLGLALIPLTCGLAWYLAAEEIRDSIDDDLTEGAALLGAISRGELGIAPRTELDDLPPMAGDVVGRTESGVQFFDEQGLAIGPNYFPLADDTVARLEAADGPILETVNHEDVQLRVLTSTVTLNDPPLGPVRRLSTVQFYRDITAEQASINTLALQLALLASLGMAAVAVAGWFVGRRLANPLDQLTEVAERLARFEDPPARIEISRTDEIGRLADSFNRMLSALEVGREQQRRLVADASHELRTPLTSLRLRTEFLAGRPTVDEAQANMLAGAVVEVEQLSALVNDLVDLAADVRSVDEEPRPMAMAEIADEVAVRTSLASGHQIDVAVGGEVEDTVAEVRPTMIRRALQNLVDNAIKYGPQDGPITIAVGPDRIEVSDRGPGIAAEDADYVFDRFYRSPKARTRPGNGIGLAIVKQVAEAHGGRTWVEAGTSGVGVTVGFSVAEPDRPVEGAKTLVESVE